MEATFRGDEKENRSYRHNEWALFFQRGSANFFGVVSREFDCLLIRCYRVRIRGTG